MWQISLAHWPAHCGSLTASGFPWLSLAHLLGLRLSQTPLTLSLALTGSLCLSSSHSGSHWLSLPLSGSPLNFNFTYIVLARLTRSLLGSQRRCHTDAPYPDLDGDDDRDDDFDRDDGKYCNYDTSTQAERTCNPVQSELFLTLR